MPLSHFLLEKPFCPSPVLICGLSSDYPQILSPFRALNLKCTNAKHPDLYGHYREAKFTQTKHHWWWKANRVFDQLLVTRNHTGMVLFLEEDHYVAEDFLHVLRLMERTCKLSCERCNVLSLGTYLKTYNYFTDFSRKVRTSPYLLRTFATHSWFCFARCSIHRIRNVPYTGRALTRDTFTRRSTMRRLSALLENLC